MAKQPLIKQKPKHRTLTQPAKPAAIQATAPAADLRLTRAQVARQLGTSIASVRRWEERGLLHPEISSVDQVRYFDPAEVTALGPQLARVPREARAMAPPPDPEGEIAARAFERFEQRQSLAEVVIGLRLTPERVRTLFHEWNLGLVRGELARRQPALTPSRMATVDRPTLDGLCAALPVGVPTRIGIARDLGTWSLEDGTDVPDVQELNGFITHGPIRVDDLPRRYGHGRLRITAIALPEGNFLWEVLTPHI